MNRALRHEEKALRREAREVGDSIIIHMQSYFKSCYIIVRLNIYTSSARPFYGYTIYRYLLMCSWYSLTID